VWRGPVDEAYIPAVVQPSWLAIAGTFLVVVMNTRQRLLCGVAAVIGVQSNGDAQPYSSAQGLVGNPNGFDIRLRGALRYSPQGYSHVERTRKRWRAGPPLVNASGYCGRRGST
jgi:hypothetical protein